MSVTSESTCWIFNMVTRTLNKCTGLFSSHRKSHLIQLMQRSIYHKKSLDSWNPRAGNTILSSPWEFYSWREMRSFCGWVMFHLCNSLCFSYCYCAFLHRLASSAYSLACVGLSKGCTIPVSLGLFIWPGSALEKPTFQHREEGHRL